MLNTPVIDRREFLAAAALTAQQAEISAEQFSQPPVVDTHMHVWTPDVARWPYAHPYTDSFKAPQHAASYEELIQDMDANGVTHAVLVQTIFHGWDNRYTLYCLRRNPDRFRAHGLIDPTDPRVAERFRYWVVRQGMQGMRFSPIYYRDGQNGGDGWITNRAHHKMWRIAERQQAVFNFFIHSSQLKQLATMVQRHPGVRVIVDHVSQIDLAESDAQQQLDELLSLSRFDNVYVKITDLTSVSISKEYPFQESYSYLRQVVDAFGSRRILWGTGYPGRCRLDYNRPTCRKELELVRQHFDFLTESQKNAYLGENAIRIWGF